MTWIDKKLDEFEPLFPNSLKAARQIPWVVAPPFKERLIGMIRAALEEAWRHGVDAASREAGIVALAAHRSGLTRALELIDEHDPAGKDANPFYWGKQLRAAIKKELTP